MARGRVGIAGDLTIQSLEIQSRAFPYKRFKEDGSFWGEFDLVDDGVRNLTVVLNGGVIFDRYYEPDEIEDYKATRKAFMEFLRMGGPDGN